MTDLPDTASEALGDTEDLAPPWAEWMEMGKAMRRSQFDELGAPARHILFLGDSITEGCLWSEWLPDLPTLNRGIAGDTIRELSARLETAINDPLAISLLIGTNDLGGGIPGFEQPLADPRKLAEAFQALVSAIRVIAPETPLIINGIMPRTEKYAELILDLNEYYRRIARTAGAHFVDLWPTLAVGREINVEYSLDQLHLTGPGYGAWISRLAPVLTAVINNS